MQQRLSLALSWASISGFVINVVSDHKTCDEIFPQSSEVPRTNSMQQSIFHKSLQQSLLPGGLFPGCVIQLKITSMGGIVKFSETHNDLMI
jgi:hypothetical protein